MCRFAYLQFVYPYGSTLNVRSPANILLTTGSAVYPFNRPLAGYYCHANGGKIMAIGSGSMFEDKYVGEETNIAIWDYLLRLLTGDSIKLTANDFNDIDVNDNKLIPDTIFMAEQPKLCLPESMDCDIPADFKDMFDMRLHSVNNDLLPEVIACYDQLSVKYEPLKLIKPQFEIPLPPLQLAVSGEPSNMFLTWIFIEINLSFFESFRRRSFRRYSANYRHRHWNYSISTRRSARTACNSPS